MCNKFVFILFSSLTSRPVCSLPMHTPPPCQNLAVDVILNVSLNRSCTFYDASGLQTVTDYQYQFILLIQYTCVSLKCSAISAH